MAVDESNIVKKITLGNVDMNTETFNDETKDIGAEAENIIVSYNNHNEIITDLAHNTVDHNEPLAITLREMKSTFQNGVDTIYNAIIAEGITPSASTPSDCAAGVHDLTEITWTEYLTIVDTNAQGYMIPCKNLKSIQVIEKNSGVTGEFASHNVYYTYNPTTKKIIAHWTFLGDIQIISSDPINPDIPVDIPILDNSQLNTIVADVSSGGYILIKLIYQTKILRGKDDIYPV